MYELPGDVFVCGQLLPAQLEALKDQGIQSLINNRPDQEAPLQPLSEDMEGAAQDLSVDYHYIPMLGGLTSDLIEASSKAYENTPRPIVAFCASGMRSAALWAFQASRSAATASACFLIVSTSTGDNTFLTIM